MILVSFIARMELFKLLEPQLAWYGCNCKVFGTGMIRNGSSFIRASLELVVCDVHFADASVCITHAYDGFIINRYHFEYADPQFFELVVSKMCELYSYYFAR